MEIEIINISDQNGPEGDVARHRLNLNKKKMDEIRKQIRQIQQGNSKTDRSTDDLEMMEIENMGNRQLLNQNRKLYDAKNQAYACQDMALDIKVNLKAQRDQLENQTLKNIYGIQEETSISKKMINAIEVQRRKNKFVLWAIYFLIGILIIFVFFQTFGFLIPNMGNFGNENENDEN